jgi:hypothetical protein
MESLARIIWLFVPVMVGRESSAVRWGGVVESWWDCRLAVELGLREPFSEVCDCDCECDCDCAVGGEIGGIGRCAKGGLSVVVLVVYSSSWLASITHP